MKNLILILAVTAISLTECKTGQTSLINKFENDILAHNIITHLRFANDRCNGTQHDTIEFIKGPADYLISVMVTDYSDTVGRFQAQKILTINKTRERDSLYSQWTYTFDANGNLKTIRYSYGYTAKSPHYSYSTRFIEDAPPEEKRSYEKDIRAILYYAYHLYDMPPKKK